MPSSSDPFGDDGGYENPEDQTDDAADEDD